MNASLLLFIENLHYLARSPRKIDPCFHDSRQCFFNVLRLKMKFVTLQYFTIFRKNIIIIDRNDSAMTLFSISHGCYLLIYLL